MRKALSDPSNIASRVAPSERISLPTPSSPSDTHTSWNAALEELGMFPQWVCWRWENSKKVPVSPRTGKRADATNPATWDTYVRAVTAAEEHGYAGIGFVFSCDDSYAGVDLDDCVDTETGEVEPWAEEIVKDFGSYTEVSPSGTGMKIWIRATKPGNRARAGNIEIYDSGRFFTFTGRHFGSWQGIASRQEELDALYERLFPTRDVAAGLQQEATALIVERSDAELLDKARNATTGSQFSKLYDRGDWEGFRSQSEADIRLCGILAFWFGKDAERMRRVFLNSALALTLDRKSNPDAYLDATIARAIENNANVYDPSFRSEASNEVRSMLTGCAQYATEAPWEGRSGPTDHDVYRALIDTGLLYGRAHRDGVLVYASRRDLALGSGVGRLATVTASLKRLEDKRGLIVKCDAGGPHAASTYLIRRAPNRTIDNRVNKYGTGSRAGRGLPDSRKVRNPSPHIETIGKRAAHILDYIHSREWVVTFVVPPVS